MTGQNPRRTADAPSERTMRVLWVTFVLAIGSALIGAMYALHDATSSSTETENPTQLSHSVKSGSAFDK